MWREEAGNELWLSDLRVVLPDGVLERGSVKVEGGVITDIVEGPAPHGSFPIGRLSGQGHTLIPGIIDLHGGFWQLSS